MIGPKTRTTTIAVLALAAGVGTNLMIGATLLTGLLGGLITGIVYIALDYIIPEPA